jgi:hypothetical protein
MSTSNWLAGVQQSDYHFDWSRVEMAGHDYKWLGRFVGDWDKELEKIKQLAQPKTWGSRGKKYHPEHPDLIAEENDLRNAGMSTETVIFRKHFEFEGVWKNMIESLGMTDTKQAFHIQYPGEMLNLHIDKQFEMNDDYKKVARFFIFLEDWKPGHFVQMGTSFMQWKRGDLVWFDWKNIPHATANAGWEPRCLIQITGTITQTTQDFFLGRHKTVNIT